MDLATVLQRPFKDPNWLVTCLKAGVLTLIPIAGVLIALGWARRVYEAFAEGHDVLPDPFADVGGDLGRGLPLLAAGLVGGAPVFVLLLILFCCGGAVDAMGGFGAGTLLATAVAVPLYLVSLAILPLCWSIHLRTGEWLVWKHMGEAWSRVTADPARFGMCVLGVVVSMTVSSVGTFLCCVGVLVTSPLGTAMLMSTLLAYDREA